MRTGCRAVVVDIVTRRVGVARGVCIIRIIIVVAVTPPFLSNSGGTATITIPLPELIKRHGNWYQQGVMCGNGGGMMFEEETPITAGTFNVTTTATVIKFRQECLHVGRVFWIISVVVIIQ